jgi:hypothetical protein
MEVKSRCFFLGCECTGLLSSGSHHAEWVDAAGAQDRPLFVSNVVSHGSGGKKADVHSHHSLTRAWVSSHCSLSRVSFAVTLSKRR